ncbi:MAG: hypothetical protein R2771_02590 [Saprospiraceae bacterium]
MRQFESKKLDSKGDLIDGTVIIKTKNTILDKEYKIVNSEDKSKVLLFKPNNNNALDCVIFDTNKFSTLMTKP